MITPCVMSRDDACESDETIPTIPSAMKRGSLSVLEPRSPERRRRARVVDEDEEDSDPGFFRRVSSREELIAEIAAGLPPFPRSNSLDFVHVAPSVILYLLREVHDPNGKQVLGSDTAHGVTRDAVDMRSSDGVRIAWASIDIEVLLRRDSFEPGDGALELAFEMMDRAGGASNPFLTERHIAKVAQSIDSDVLRRVLVHPKCPSLGDDTLAEIYASERVRRGNSGDAAREYARRNDAWRPGKEMALQAVAHADRELFDLIDFRAGVLRPLLLQAALELTMGDYWGADGAHFDILRYPSPYGKKEQAAKMVEDLVRFGCPVSAKVLLAASEQGDLVALEHALRVGGREVLSEGERALIRAARRGHTTAVEILCDHGVEIVTPALDNAILRADKKMVCYLLDKGGKPGDYTVGCAIAVRDWDTVRRLMEDNPHHRVNARTLLRAASVDSHLAQYLLEKSWGGEGGDESVGATINEMGKDSETWPLAVFAEDGRILLDGELNFEIPRSSSGRLYVPQYPDRPFAPRHALDDSP